MEKKKRARTKLVTTGKEELNNEKSQINKRKRTKKSENFVEKLTAYVCNYKEKMLLKLLDHIQ